MIIKIHCCHMLGLHSIGVANIRCSPICFDMLIRRTSFKIFSRKLAQTFNSSFHYIDDVLSLNNSRFGDYLHRIYPNELKVKDNSNTQKCAFYFDLHIEIDNGGRLKTKLYDKRSQLPLHEKQYSSITSVWSLQFTTTSTFNRKTTSPENKINYNT